ncbi:MAG: GNAT family N-acetyltransferase [Prevotella sp.]|jgi:GNAT superfamily N-acetyltransferase|nr:GNAT family N-acetyltransferase [Prevotella sp.]
MDNFLIEQIQSSEIEEVSIILMNAFLTNPAYAAVFKDKFRLEEGLQWLFRASLSINNQKQTLTMVVKERNSMKIIGTFTLIPPQGVKRNIRAYTKIGIWSFISKFGFYTLIRMLNLDSINKDLLIKSLKSSKHYYLSMVVIKEEYRGKGIASFALKQTINNLIDSNPTCRVIGLTTQLPENVVFYSRLGFNKLDEGYVTFKESKYYNYTMKYDL